MADLGTLKVTIGADDKQLQRVATDSKRRLNEIGDSMKRLAKVGAALGVAMTGLAAVFLTKVVSSQLKTLDALVKTSDALGIQTEKLQAMQHLAELTGSSSEQLNKSLERMERRLGEIARIGGTAEFALKDLGLNIDEIVRMSPDQQFEQLAIALSKVENQSVKASIANDIFGRSGLKMLRLMEQLTDEGLRPAIEELDALGFSINRVEAAQIEAANDAMLRFQKGIQGVFQSLTIQLAPVLEAISVLLIDWIKQSGGADKVMGDLVEGMISGFGAVADVITVVARLISKIVNGIKAVFNAVGAGIARVKTFIGQFVNLENSIGNPLQQTTDGINELTANLPSERFRKFFNDFKEQSREAAEAVAKDFDAKKITGNFDSAFFEERNQKVAQQRAQGLEQFRESLRTEEESEIASYQKRLEQLDTFLAEGQIKKDEADKARQIIEQQHQDALTEITRSGEMARSSLVKDAIESQLGNIQSVLQSITSVTGKEGKKQFELTKVASIASALVKGYESITSSFAAGAKIGGPPLGFAFAATAAAAVAGQIAAIKAQQFSAAGSVTAGAGGGGGGVQAGGQAAAATPQNTLRIETVGSGSFVNREAVDAIIDEINSLVGDGKVLISSEVVT